MRLRLHRLFSAQVRPWLHRLFSDQVGAMASLPYLLLEVDIAVVKMYLFLVHQSVERFIDGFTR